MQRLKIEYCYKDFIEQEIWELEGFHDINEIKKLVRTFIKENKYILPFNSFEYYPTNDDFFRENEIGDNEFKSKKEYISI